MVITIDIKDQAAVQDFADANNIQPTAAEVKAALIAYIKQGVLNRRADKAARASEIIERGKTVDIS